MESINIGRTFRVGERKSLEVRAEFFNVLNRMELNGPTTNSPQGARSCSLTVPTAGLPGSVNVAAVRTVARRATLRLRDSAPSAIPGWRSNRATAKSSPASRSKRRHRLSAAVCLSPRLCVTDCKSAADGSDDALGIIRSQSRTARGTEGRPRRRSSVAARPAASCNSARRKSRLPWTGLPIYNPADCCAFWDGELSSSLQITRANSWSVALPRLGCAISR